MTDHEIETFVEALLGDQTPKHFQVAPEDRDVLQFALALRAQRPEIVSPEPSFVDQLHRQLASSAGNGGTIVSLPARPRHDGKRNRGPARTAIKPPPGRISRSFQAVAKAAAAAAVIAGTVTATHLVDRPFPARVAQGAANAGAVHSGVLLSADGRTLGRAYAYNGNPSWVFMDVQASRLSGLYACHLQLADGTTVTAGAVTVYHGAGDWAHTVKVSANQIREATLVAPDGAIMARATFS